MKTAMINIKTDHALKEEAQELARELGFSLSAIVTASLKQFVRARAVQFSAQPRMTPYLEEVIAGVEKDLKAKQNLSPAFARAKLASAYLHKAKRA